MSLLKFLGLAQPTDSTPATSDTETVRKITQALDEMDPKQAGYIAAFAYILGRVAHADMDISSEEIREMERTVMDLGQLPEEQAIIVVQIAKTQNVLFGGTENYLVTREFNKVATREQKITLLHCLFAVSSTDQDISSQEDRAIRQITSELKLEHKDFISVRSQYRHHLSVLKTPEDS
ncbi:MAG: TerB family tellurite resistance protein [Acidobacteriota bacterium]